MNLEFSHRMKEVGRGPKALSGKGEEGDGLDTHPSIFKGKSPSPDFLKGEKRQRLEKWGEN